QLRLRVVGDQFQGTCQTHQFVRRLAAAEPVELPPEKLVLAFAREPARHSAPEDIFLALDAPTGKTRAGIVQPPQGVDAKVITENAEARAQQESGYDEPIFFVVHREPPAVQALVQRRPKGAQQGSVPSAPWRAKDSLQALEDRAGSHLVPFSGRAGEYGPD